MRVRASGGKSETKTAQTVPGAGETWQGEVSTQIFILNDIKLHTEILENEEKKGEGKGTRRMRSCLARIRSTPRLDWNFDIFSLSL